MKSNGSVESCKQVHFEVLMHFYIPDIGCFDIHQRCH
jgi:hypothetical protein